MKYQRRPVAQPQTSVAWHDPDSDSYPFFVVFLRCLSSVSSFGVFAGLPFSIAAINPSALHGASLYHSPESDRGLRGYRTASVATIWVWLSTIMGRISRFGMAQTAAHQACPLSYPCREQRLGLRRLSLIGSVSLFSVAAVALVALLVFVACHGFSWLGTRDPRSQIPVSNRRTRSVASSARCRTIAASTPPIG